MFEIQKVEKDDSELEKIKEKMGLLGQQNEEATQKSGGFDSKVETTPTQKSRHNTPNSILPTKESSSTDPDPAASDDVFYKELKTILSEASIKNHNSNTLKNIKNYSNGDINEVKKVIEFIKLKSKNMNSKVLVAILKDKDHQIVEPVDLKKITRKEKIDFMVKKLGEFKIRSMRNAILKNIGCECQGVDDDLGNQLCKKYNEIKTQGGVE